MVDLASLLSDEDGDYRNKVKVSVISPLTPIVRRRNREVLHKRRPFRTGQGCPSAQERLRNPEVVGKARS